MNDTIKRFKSGLRVKRDAEKKYRALRKHLDTLPVGYPSTFTGVELKLLESMFTVEEAEAAMVMGWKPETIGEMFRRAKKKGFTEDRFKMLVESMAASGAVFTISGKEKRYALHPLVIGMYEMQLKRLTPELYLNIRDYMTQAFAIEYYTSKARQMRVIPVQKSVIPQMAVAAYDDIRELVDRAGNRIGVSECICKVAKDKLGNHCKVTDRREVCLGFRDFHDIYKRNGWGRSITKKEAMKILDQNEKEGLVLMPSTMQEPQFVCSCCSCCCGILEIVGMLPRTADFVESNYRAELKPETCAACGLCGTRCQIHAISMEGKKAVAIDEKKCIGCGVCVAACKSGSLRLVKKEKEFVPPKDVDGLWELIDENKKSRVGKMAMAAKAMLGFKV